MLSDAELQINERVVIPQREIRFRFSPSGGPGGQHANRSATQVELLFDVGGSPSLSEEERGRVLVALKGYIDRERTLHLVSQSTRSQYRNREDVLRRFQAMLRRALRVPKVRRPTRPTTAARRARLEAKRRQGAIKRARRLPSEAE